MKISKKRLKEITLEPLLKYHYFQPLTVDLSNRIFEALGVKMKAKRTYPELKEPGLAKYINYDDNEQEHKRASQIANEYWITVHYLLSGQIISAFAIAETITPENCEEIIQELLNRKQVIIYDDELTD